MAYRGNSTGQKIKIDRSLGRELTTNCDSVAIVKAIITLGHGLRLELIAMASGNPESGPMSS
ncbi:MAG: hypothetical protein KAX51_07870 [Chromatiaceae bacterium]|nr:hypothetical protein [Chromatiaceae bacterium]